MSTLLTKEQANMIVQKLMSDIPYNINIMNEQGYIIASGKEQRIGERHRGAERAIAQRKMVEVFKDTSLEKRGTNEPILLNGELLGVVGISG
ncbi:sugar diacid recognition domain-containing protein [Enterococcus viikkiensis]|nr:sugar diacid recognition domain-containing protein [Enterococcus viikkiensis]MDT2827044.1 sugar diacid recognition domain-containing protein [Enterococcus viikkiensis]